MGFWDVVGSLVEMGAEKISECTDKYENSYNSNSERYSYMSDERLKKEIKNLKEQTGGDSFKKAGKRKALLDELESRRG